MRIAVTVEIGHCLRGSAVDRHIPGRANPVDFFLNGLLLTRVRRSVNKLTFRGIWRL